MPQKVFAIMKVPTVADATGLLHIRPGQVCLSANPSAGQLFTFTGVLPRSVLEGRLPPAGAQGLNRGCKWTNCREGWALKA